ncbi:hypothetical protein OG426_01640 [Streptomyces canus]|uniref:PIG-L family deacetylase n=1 Tax=Streptomyces canus TaxID=58343 RepID=UPI003865684C|nr:hypothetical protein OG426_01640 [Streptomyces canus]
MELAGHPDGGLTDVPRHRLASETARLIGERRPSRILVFDPGCVTGHRDHQLATSAAQFAAGQAGVAVLG